MALEWNKPLRNYATRQIFWFKFINSYIRSCFNIFNNAGLKPINTRKKLSDIKFIVIAYLVSFLFLAGGIANVIMLPAPMWFSTLDLVVAYLPSAWLGHTLAIHTLRDGN